MAIRTQGTRLEIGDTASPIVYTNVAGATDINGPTGGRPLIDITTLASTGREFLTGIPDYGNIDFTLIYDNTNAQHLDMYDLFQSGLLRSFRLVFGDSSPEEIYTLDAYVLNWQFAAPIDEVVRVSVTLKITGTPVDNN